MVVTAFIRLCVLAHLIVLLPLIGAEADSNLTWADYDSAVLSGELVSISGSPLGDGSRLDAVLYMPEGDGPFPALVALHGAGGVFPYQLWWAQWLSEQGYAVLFVDSYCTRGHLCAHDTDDQDKRRGAIMRSWRKVGIRQRIIDAASGYQYLLSHESVKSEEIGVIGWSWGGTSALGAQKLARKLSLQEGGFKLSIAFYPNLREVINHRQWRKLGNLNRPTLILYGESDALESKASYDQLIAENQKIPLRIVSYKDAVRKFDELGEERIKRHPSVGRFKKAFHGPSFEDALSRVLSFLNKHLESELVTD